MAFTNLLEVVYPVGSIYISTLSTSPAEIIGGTWVQLTDAVLRAAEEVGYIGEDTHTQTIDEMPSHNHGIDCDSSHVTGGQRIATAGNTSTTHFTSTGMVKTGGGQPMSIVQRSYNCFMWQRTA